MIHTEDQDDGRMRIVVELRKPRRRLFEIFVPLDVDMDELACLVLEVQEIVRRRRGQVQ